MHDDGPVIALVKRRAGFIKGRNPRMQTASANIPHHVAIIMDGNGRWAKQRGLPRIEGHRQGVEAVRGVIDAARQLGIRFLTLYAFSAENWQRPRDRADEAAGVFPAA
jgi:undecaprenyl diphosphate synthase